MNYSIKLLEEKMHSVKYNLKEYIHLKHTDTWKELNAAKRCYRRSIKLLKAGRAG